MYNSALHIGVFGTRWKKARLALIKNPSKPAGLPSFYRLLRLLDTIGKIFERVICTRLEAHLERKKFISCRQYGFRAGRSIVDAAALQVVKTEKCATSSKKFDAAIRLDIKNAFNIIP